MANGKKFSVDFQQAQEIENTTQILIQSEGWPVQKATLEQIGRALINGNIVPSITGNYPKMSVGFTENVVGDGSTTAEVFSFRPTAGVNRNTLNDGAARIHTLKGNSVVWNQLVDTNTTSVTMTANHIYVTSIGGIITRQSPLSDTPISVDATTDKVTDLTKMFGAGNEPTTIAEFYQRRPVGLDLAAYNEGEIVDGHYGAIKTTGFNQWDERWEVGMFNTSTGEQDISYENIRNVNPIRVLPNTTYYEKQPIADNLLMYVLEYTQEGTYIGFQYVYNNTFTTSPNTAYVNFYMAKVYGTVYNNDICISLYWPTEYGNLYGTYKPYKPFERDLSWVNKYFPNGMRSAGNVADEIRFNSTTQQWEAVQRVDVRPYAAGDESDSAVTTDGTNTNYTLPTPTITPIAENVNFDYDVSDYGTEELIVAEGVESAPLSASIEYSQNVLAVLKNAPGIANDVDMLKSQLSAITAQLATLTLNNN